MVNFVIGLVLGLVQIGSHNYRMISIVERKPIKVLLSSLVVSCVYFFSVKLVVDNNWASYIGFSIGAAFITTGLACRKDYNPNPGLDNESST